MELGERMALQVWAASEPSKAPRATESGSKGSQSASAIAMCAWKRDWAKRDSRTCRAVKNLDSIAAMANSTRESKEVASPPTAHATTSGSGRGSVNSVGSEVSRAQQLHV